MKRTAITILLSIIFTSSYSQWTNATNISNTNTGNVGIGTSAPISKLDVYGSGNFTGSLQIGQAAVNSNSTKLFIKNDLGNGKNWALSAGANSHTEEGFHLYNWTDNSSSPILSIYNNGSTIIRNTEGSTLNLEKSSTNIPGILFRGKTSTSSIEGGDDYITTYVGGNRRFTILSNGNIGIGTISPQTPLFVDGPANSNGLVRLGGGFDYGSSTVLSLAPGTISFDAPGVLGGRFTILGSNGNVGIGIANPNEKLAVNGTIRTKEVKVENTFWPDYVFSTGFDLKPLSAIKAYVEENHHLPEIPSSAEVMKNGINLGEMNALLLKKIEELTLHLIQKEDQLTRQDARLNKQERQIFEILKQLKITKNNK